MVNLNMNSSAPHPYGRIRGRPESRKNSFDLKQRLHTAAPGCTMGGLQLYFPQRPPFSKVSFLHSIGSLELLVAATSTHELPSGSTAYGRHVFFLCVPHGLWAPKVGNRFPSPLLFVPGMGLACTVKARTMEWNHLQYTKKRGTTFHKCPGLKTQGWRVTSLPNLQWPGIPVKRVACRPCLILLGSKPRQSPWTSGSFLKDWLERWVNLLNIFFLFNKTATQNKNWNPVVGLCSTPSPHHTAFSSSCLMTAFGHSTFVWE